MAELRRTVITKLDLPEGADESLSGTIDQFKHCTNTASEWCWHGDDGYHVTSKAKAERALYADLKADTDLTANLVQKGIRRAVEAVKSGVERLKDGERTSRPTFRKPSVVYDKRSATFNEHHATLSTVDGRIRVDYVLPGDPEGTPHGRYLLNDDYEPRMATLQYDADADEWFLHISLRNYDGDGEPESDSSTEHTTVLGVDLGIDTIAATSTGKMWSGGYLNHRREQYEQVRGSLQQRGTQSAHRTIESIGKRETRWADDHLHCISKALVQEADAYDCDAIVFEELTHIRDRMPGAKKFHAWAFRRLYEYTEYKTEAYGIDVVQVNPAYTSQRCSKCGTTLEKNRPNGDHRFECQKCGYAVHADYNASKNIAMKHVRRRQKSIGGRPRVNVALKSGTLNANGRYSSTVA